MVSIDDHGRRVSEAPVEVHQSAEVTRKSRESVVAEPEHVQVSEFTYTVLHSKRII